MPNMTSRESAPTDGTVCKGTWRLICGKCGVFWGSRDDRCRDVWRRSSYAMRSANMVQVPNIESCCGNAMNSIPTASVFLLHIHRRPLALQQNMVYCGGGVTLGVGFPIFLSNAIPWITWNGKHGVATLSIGFPALCPM